MMRIEFEGRIHEFPDDFTDEDIARALGGSQPEPSPDIGTDILKGVSHGFNEGVDATLNFIGAPVRGLVNYAADQMGYEGQLIPELKLARHANLAGGGETQAGRVAQTIGEVIGGSALPTGALGGTARYIGSHAPGILAQYARSPATAAGLDALAATGAGAGVALARENELGPAGEIAAGLAGGLLAPNAVNAASRTYSGARSGLDYANKQIARARNPETAAYQDIADQGVKAGLDFSEARSAVTPALSGDLGRRGFTDEDMMQIISRQLDGERADDVVQDFAHLVDGRGRQLTGTTARAYLQRYLDENPTQMNVVDLAKEQLPPGKAMPLANQARADMAISDDAAAANRLIQRQREQPGRVADIVEQSTVNGRNFDQEIERLSTIARQEERAAYHQARQSAQRINIRGVLRRWRGRRPHEGGQVNNAINRAVDLFFRGGLSETGERLTYRRLNEIVDDVPTYLERRRELDQMIATSIQDGRPTPLTRELTQFRTEINHAARSNNPALRDADARFSENRTIERILTRGANIGSRLTPQTRAALRDFRDMTLAQQELHRVAFERKLADNALNRRSGHAAADQYNSDAFRDIVETMYPPPRSPRGAQRALEQQIHHRGQRILRNLRRESITTETARDVLSGSRTAPLQDDMAQLMEGPRAAADLATGRYGKILENISNRLARHIGQSAARDRIRILTETDPAALLQILNRLEQASRSSLRRNELANQLREFGRVGHRTPAYIGAISDHWLSEE